jgi:hypothetical protein
MKTKYFKPNTKLAIKFAIAIKGLTASLVAMAYVSNKPNLMFGIMIVGAVMNELINFLSDKTDESTKSE